MVGPFNLHKIDDEVLFAIIDHHNHLDLLNLAMLRIASKTFATFVRGNSLVVVLPAAIFQSHTHSVYTPISTVFNYRCFATQAKKNAKKKPGQNVKNTKVVQPKQNEEITCETVRLVTFNPDTRETTNEMMPTRDALTKAQAMGKDLLMVNERADPPIVKIDVFLDVIREKAQIKKVKVKALKALELKEMLVKANIDDKDMNRKLEKVRQWLVRSAQVKITLVSNFQKHRANPLALDEALVKVTEMLDGYAASVQEPKIINHMRKTFLVSPLTGPDLTNLHKRIGFIPTAVKLSADQAKAYKMDLNTQRIVTNVTREKFKNANLLELQEAVAKQGDLVREMKRNLKTGDEIKSAVAKLLLLKEMSARCPIDGSLGDDFDDADDLGDEDETEEGDSDSASSEDSDEDSEDDDDDESDDEDDEGVDEEAELKEWQQKGTYDDDDNDGRGKGKKRYMDKGPIKTGGR